MVYLHLSLLHLFILLSLRDLTASPTRSPIPHEKQKPSEVSHQSYSKSYKVLQGLTPTCLQLYLVQHSPLFSLYRPHWPVLFWSFSCHLSQGLFTCCFILNILPSSLRSTKILPSGISSGIFSSEKPSLLFQALITSVPLLGRTYFTFIFQ